MTTVSNDLIRSGIRFLKDLQNDLGTEKGLEVWDKLRESMGDEVAGQVLFGIIKGTHSDIRLTKIGPQKIDAIKLVRECTGMGLKEAKDLVERVEYNRFPQDLNISNLPYEHFDRYIRRFKEIGCEVE